VSILAKLNWVTAVEVVKDVAQLVYDLSEESGPVLDAAKAVYAAVEAAGFAGLKEALVALQAAVVADVNAPQVQDDIAKILALIP
jgi:hypothetical protein